MRIVYVSFDFGWCLSAEGLVGERLVNALLDTGATVVVVTSEFGISKIRHSKFSLIKVPAWPRHPRWLFHAQSAWRYRIKKMKLPEKPDFVYGRACPLASVLAAKTLAERFGVPLISHFSDPLPSPWSSPNKRFVSADAKAVREVIGLSKAITFTTREALMWQERRVGESFGDRAFVLNHVASKRKQFSNQSAGGGVEAAFSFVYTGMLYGRRTADDVLAGFRELVDEDPDVHFTFIGPAASMVLPVAKHLNLLEFGHVSCFPRTPDINGYLEKANVLVALDANDEDPVFLSVKFIDYAFVNRPILLISPPQSPASQWARKMGPSVVCSSCDPKDISENMKRLRAFHISPEDYEMRLSVLREFEGSAVAAYFLKKAQEYL